MWAIIPAAGNGSRIQPLAFSKELLPVGSRTDESGIERPRAVSEYLVDRMILGGAEKICFVISSSKGDILQYFGGNVLGADVVYACQAGANGLCDAVFRALPVISDDEQVLIGLPDTIWFPPGALAELPDGRFSLLLFPVEHPELFDAVVLDSDSRVRAIEVKSPTASSKWIWGAMKMSGATLRALNALWRKRDRSDEYLGTLINAWLAVGGTAWGVCAGSSYVDVGTVHGYREAIRLLSEHSETAETRRSPSRNTVGA